jgi:hypothetical protein
MSTPTWPFTEIPFDNGTKGSYKKMNIISADTDSKLFGQQVIPAILALFIYFNVFRAAYLAAYVKWKSKKAAYRSATEYVYQLLAQLSGDKIEEFDIRIQVIYRRGTPQYINLFPDLREPFQKGEIDERITALATLLSNIDVDPALALIKADILVFYNLIVAARNQQQAREGEVDMLSAELELERINCARAMYYVLGGLMQHFKDNASQIADFFDLETLRGHISDVVDLIFEGPVNGNTIVNVLNPLIEQYVVGVTLRIKNTTAGPAIGGLFFYAADNATDGWTGLGQQLLPGQEATITLTAAQFRAFFNVQNQGPNLQSYEVEIIIP